MQLSKQEQLLGGDQSIWVKLYISVHKESEEEIGMIH